MGSSERRYLLAHAAVVALFVLATLDREPFDDAYFFKRVAVNWLERGSPAWNVEDGPVYGATSQLFQLVTLFVAGLLRSYTVLATRVLLAGSVIAAYALLLRTRAEDRGAAATLCCCSPPVLFAVVTGMDTALAILLLALLLWLVLGTGTTRHWALAPGVVVLLYATRPDAALLAVPVLLGQRWITTSRTPWREGLLVVAGIGALLVSFRLYYGTALPLPAHAKTFGLSPYDAAFLAQSAALRRLHFGLFAAAALPLLALAGTRRDATSWTLLGSAALFVTYHYVATVDVMGMYARFYAPALPLLSVAAARAGAGRWAAPAVALALVLLYALKLVPTTGTAAVPLPLYAAFAVSAVAVLATTRATWAVPLVTGLGIAASFGWSGRGSYDDAGYLARTLRRTTSFRGIDALRACLGERLHVYHSELGVTGLYFQHGRVTDLVGLWSPERLWRRTSFEAACARDRPDAIFLPHRNYAALEREVAASRCLERYVRVVEASSAPLHVRADLADRYRRCAAQRGIE